MKLRVMTFNTQHCKNYISKKFDYKSIIDLIAKYNVDIIGLNEVYNIPNQTKIISNGKYYHFGKSSNLIIPYGNSIISKYNIVNNKIIKIKYLKSFKYIENRSILKSTINVNDNLLNIYVLHLGLTDIEKEIGINTLINNLDDNCIVLGDFNMTPDNKLIKKLSNKLINCSNDYTYPSDNPKYKLDYIFVSKNIKVINSIVVDEVISDHRAVITDIIIK